MTILQADLDGFAEPEVIEELDFEATLAAAKAKMIELFPAIAPVLDLESEPATKLLEVTSFREMLLRARINDAARASLLAYATGDALDHLAAFYDVIRLSGETDDALRARVILAISGRSPGGTADRYRYIALSASTDVADAEVYTEPLSPVVHVAIYSTADGGIADDGLLEIVAAALNADDVRMVSDTINVRSAVTETVDIEARVWLLPDTTSEVITNLPANLRADFAAEGGLGFDLTHSWLIARMMRPGVQRVEIVAPAADVQMDGYEALALGEIEITYMGRDM